MRLRSYYSSVGFRSTRRRWRERCLLLFENKHHYVAKQKWYKYSIESLDLYQYTIDYERDHIWKKIMQYNALSITTRSRIVENPKRGLEIIEDAGSIGANMVCKYKKKTVFQSSYTLIGITPIWIFAPNLADHVICFDYFSKI